MSYTCQTAPNVTFASREELHAHYKSEWHRFVFSFFVAVVSCFMSRCTAAFPFARRDSSPLLCSLVYRYNLKRKVSSLPAVSVEEFETRKAAALALSDEQRKKAGVGYVMHLLYVCCCPHGVDLKLKNFTPPPSVPRSTGTSHLKQDKAQNAAKKEKAKIKHAFKLAKAQGALPPTAELSPDALAKDVLAKVQIKEQGSPHPPLTLTPPNHKPNPYSKPPYPLNLTLFFFNPTLLTQPYP
jgi:hypothetical protein